MDQEKDKEFDTLQDSEEVKDSETESHKFTNTQSFYATPEKKNRKLLISITVIAIVVIVAVFFLISKRKNLLPIQGPTPTPTATLEPTPTPNPLIRSEWSFEVLNGSGVTGAAKKIADKLTQAGYVVVKSGNADKDNYETAQIFVKKGLEEKINLVIADLKDIVKIASVAGELKDSTASARIILGKE